MRIFPRIREDIQGVSLVSAMITLESYSTKKGFDEAYQSKL